ncbi:hypothetical protein Q4Q34_11770 [Flavivirga abyssicola]|uniref:hypothetical protein n=1 Tax=Flavivirga abyssicola TaxID=3063533 RepID=UPI0026E052F8|nr:hypothetical protein [Flavivirga sp. MEBiC07777]WVK11904.1 hypothetical protein Q4Q34_11770 [Flavivirga sp. MEBiC07777]
MKAKWYFSTLVIALTLLGVCQKQISVPNQEIVMEFVYDEVTSDEVQDAIAVVKKQLQTLGIDNIQVGEKEDGRLKITYYSDVNVASIKKMLSKEKKLALDYTSYNHEEEDSKHPSSEDKNSYNLDVYEIQKGVDGESDLNGTHVVELKHEYDRFSNPNFYIGKIDLSEEDRIVKIAYKVRRHIAIVIDDMSHNVPDVRAGPVL